MSFQWESSILGGKFCEEAEKVDPCPKVDFVVPLGETKEGFWNYELNRGDIWYDGETLILAGRRYYSDYAMSVLAYNATGPLYWGLYECSIFEARNPGVSPYIQNGSDSVVIE